MGVRVAENSLDIVDVSTDAGSNFWCVAVSESTIGGVPPDGPLDVWDRFRFG